MVGTHWETQQEGTSWWPRVGLVGVVWVLSSGDAWVHGHPRPQGLSRPDTEFLLASEGVAVCAVAIRVRSCPRGPQQAAEIGALGLPEVSLKLRGPRDSGAKVPSSLREVDVTGEQGCGVDLEAGVWSRRESEQTEKDDAKSSRMEARVEPRWQPGGSVPETTDGRAAETVFVNARMKQSTSCWRSALVSWLGWQVTGPLSSRVSASG